jgi:GAF domain-containing protein
MTGGFEQLSSAQEHEHDQPTAPEGSPDPGTAPPGAGVASAVPVEIAELARVGEGDLEARHVLGRIVDFATGLVPGCTGAALTVRSVSGEETAAVTDERVADCHAAQFVAGGEGPAREALRFGEPRRSDDLDDETRWPAFSRVARSHGFRSCLALPLRADRQAATALNLYGREPMTFLGTTYDLALLLAAQGGATLDNVELFRASRELVEHLHQALVTRGVIERAKGLLMAEHDLSSDQAFHVLRRQSQQSNQKVRDVAAALLSCHEPASSADTPWTPARRPSS